MTAQCRNEKDLLMDVLMSLMMMLLLLLTCLPCFFVSRPVSSDTSRALSLVPCPRMSRRYVRTYI